MVVHATSPKPFLLPLARAAVAPLQMRNTSMLKHLQVFGPFTMPFHRLPSYRGN